MRGNGMSGRAQPLHRRTFSASAALMPRVSSSFFRASLMVVALAMVTAGFAYAAPVPRARQRQRAAVASAAVAHGKADR